MRFYVSSLACCVAFSFSLFGQENFPVFQGYPLQDFYLDAPNGQLHYQAIGDENNPTLLLVHGSPGDVSAWKKMLEASVLLQHFYVLLVDRPGYGKTSLQGGSLAHQSAQLATFMKQHCRPCGVVGHSYGAALALQLGVDHSQNVNGLVSLAGTIAAPYQNPRWYNYIGKYTPLKWLLPKAFKTSNKEMWMLSNDLALIEEKLSSLQIPVFVYQGGKDVLVNSASGEYMAERLPYGELIFRPEKNHFVIWTDIPDLDSLVLDWKETLNW